MGCLRALAVLAVILALALGAAIWGGVTLFQRYAPAVGQYLDLAKRVQTEVPDVSNLSARLETVNGRSVLRLTVPVPFSPAAEPGQARALADRIAAVVRRGLPVAPNTLRPQRLEVRLSRAVGGATSERRFDYPLGAQSPPQRAAPEPAPGPRS